MNDKFVDETRCCRSPKGYTCDFEWIRKTWNVTRTSCSHLDYRSSFAGDYDQHDCSIRVDRAAAGDAGLWRCDLEYYKFGGGRGSSKILSKDTYVHVMDPTTTKPTTIKTTTTKPELSIKSITRGVDSPELESVSSPQHPVIISVARVVPLAISILVLVIFVVLFTLVVVLHKLKTVRQQQQQQQHQQQQHQQQPLTNRQRFEAEMQNLPSIEDVIFLKNKFPHLLKLPNHSDLGSIL